MNLIKAAVKCLEYNPTHDAKGWFATCEGCGKTINIGKDSSDSHKVSELSDHLQDAHGLSSGGAERIATKMLKNQGHI